MLANLVLATFMVTLTVVVHFGGLLGLLHILRYQGENYKVHKTVPGQFILLTLVIVGIFGIHAVEIWLYAAAYLIVGAFIDFEDALYFSTVTFSTVGFGDIVLKEDWRLFSAIESANGFLLFGWSTAFLISMTRSLRALEHDWTGEDKDNV